MTLQQVAKIGSLGTELVDSFGGPAGVVRDQVLDAANPTRQGVLNQLDVAGGRASSAFDTAAGSLERRQRALGSNVTDRERAVQKRRLGLGRALATVDARNREVGNIRSRTDIARTGAGALRDMIEGQVLNSRAQTGEAETRREVDFIQQQAEYKQRKAQGLGAIAGIGLSFVPGGQFLAPAAKGAISNG